mgnify:CR=1
HTEAHSRCIFCEAARPSRPWSINIPMRILAFPMEILTFWPPILRLTLGAFSAKPPGRH